MVHRSWPCHLIDTRQSRRATPRECRRMTAHTR
jgi:hypothetical protein